MKTLEEIKTEVANDEGWPKWGSLAAPWVPSKDLEKHWEEVAKRYAQSVAEDLRKRIIQDAFDDPYDIRRYANSIRNVEIITP